MRQAKVCNIHTCWLT